MYIKIRFQWIYLHQTNKNNKYRYSHGLYSFNVCRKSTVYRLVKWGCLFL